MYKALKDAQSDIHATLLKLVDDISGVSESRQPQVQQQAQLQEPQQAQLQELQNLQNTLGFLHQKQNAQFELLVGEIKGLKETMENMMKFMMTRDVTTATTATTIPVLQPTSQESDMKQVFIDAEDSDIQVNEELNMGFIEESDNEVDAEEAEVEPELEQEAEEEVEPEAEAEVEVEVDANAEEAEVEVEAEVDVEAEVEVEVDAEVDANAQEPEEELEVEEWTYKGRQFFKDSDNTVYANNAGEIGDPIGQYDPVKNIVKKLT